jgi:hypothetical protein
MIKRILCRECSGDRPYYVHTKKDRHSWNQRHVWLVLRTLRACNDCGRRLEGEIVHAITLWHPQRNPEPAHWEDAFGEVIPECSVRMVDSLVKGGDQ